MDNDVKYEICIIGAGIAGLALAELTSRSSESVLLLEKDNTVFAAASREHHGWFHMGSLYSIFLKNHFSKTLLGGIDDILTYYKDMHGMNLNILANGEISAKENDVNDWFKDDKIRYLLACHNSPDVSYLGKKTDFYNFTKSLIRRICWHMQVRRFIMRHNRFKKFKWTLNNLSSAPHNISNVKWRDHSRDLLSKPNLKDLTIDPNTHISLEGFDRVLSASNIARSLSYNYLHNGGQLELSNEVLMIKNLGNLWEIQSQKGIYLAEKVVLTAGKWIDEILVNGEKNNDTKRVLSPLMVVYPAICKENFVRMTPDINKTINHIYHSVDGNGYSVIGGGYQTSIKSNVSEKNEIEKLLIEQTKNHFSSQLECHKFWIYWGTKTECSKNKDRNYQYVINELQPNLWYVIPGKFSLGFSAAINSFKKIFGVDPQRSKKTLSSNNVDSIEIPLQYHAELVKNYLEKLANKGT